MSKLKLEPTPLRSLPEDVAVEAFTRGADNRSATIEAPKPDSGLDPDAPATKGINVRLNEYELSLIRQLAQSQDRSMQKVIKRVLIPALQAELAQLR